MTDTARALFDSVPRDGQWARLTPAADVVVRRGEHLRAVRRARRRVALAVLVALVVLGQLWASGGWRRAEPAAPAPVPRPTVPDLSQLRNIDLSRLPTGAPPDTVPYAIGQSIYWAGERYDVPTNHGGPVRVVHLQPVRGFVIAQVHDGDADVVGLVGPGWSWREVGAGATDVVDGGVVLVADAVEVVDPFTGESTASLPTAPGLTASASTVGHLVLVTYASEADRSRTSTLLWDPSTGRTRTLTGPGGDTGESWTVAQRRAPGWLAESASVGCVTVHVLPTLRRVGRVCSEGGYALSWNGSRAAVVRGGRLVVVEMGAPERVLATADLAQLPPALAGGRHVLRPLAWEDADTYLASVRLDDRLAIVRCHVDRPRCERVVTSQVRTGVSEIEAGW